MTDERILGTTKITDRWRISLIKAVREEFENADEPVDIGDLLIFKQKDGDIVVEPA